MLDDGVQPGSFRDPSGFVYLKNGIVYRRINQVYQKHFEKLMQSGLYRKLTDQNLLVTHDETVLPPVHTDEVFKIIKPELIPFISYPYEWCFSQLKDAALLTLKIQKMALENGMSLKDASAYNIQFLKGKPILIDTLSFEIYEEGKPWVAYRQFCQHFLAPLALMSFCDINLGKLLRVHLDGIPLDMASRLLPSKTKFRFSLLTHIHLHAKSQKKHENDSVNKPTNTINIRSLLGIIDSLETAIKKLNWRPTDTVWGNYYDETNYTSESFEKKKSLIESYIEQIKPLKVWDLGANTGEFSRIVSEKKIPVISFDVDPAVIEKNYHRCRASDEEYILPLLCDLTNPSPGIGWNNSERDSLMQRANADTVMALALIHHLTITNNLPLDMIASYFHQLGKNLIIEFVPKEDSQVQRLLKSREDIFDKYTQKDFEDSFCQYFSIEQRDQITGSERTLYLMNSK